MKLIKLLPLFGVFLFAAILWNLDWTKVIQIFLGLNPVFIAAALLLQMPIIVIKAMKWKILVRSFSVDFPLTRAIKAWLVGFSRGIVTPGRVGDLTRACYLKGRLDFGKSLTTVIADRIIDVLVLFMLSVLGILAFASFFAAGIGYGTFIVMLSVFFAFFVSAIYVSMRKGLVTRIAMPFYRAIVPGKYKKKASSVFHDFYEGLGVLMKSKKSLAASLGIGIVAWLLMIVQTYVLSLSMGIGLSLLFIASVIPVITLLDAMPISFSGVGTRDAALILFFGFISLSAEAAVSFSLIILVFNYLISAFFGFAFWIRDPIRIGSGQS